MKRFLVAAVGVFGIVGTGQAHPAKIYESVKSTCYVDTAFSEKLLLVESNSTYTATYQHPYLQREKVLVIVATDAGEIHEKEFERETPKIQAFTFAPKDTGWNVEGVAGRVTKQVKQYIETHLPFQCKNEKTTAEILESAE